MRKFGHFEHYLLLGEGWFECDRDEWTGNDPTLQGVIMRHNDITRQQA
jgi:hypothetical protein